MSLMMSNFVCLLLLDSDMNECVAWIAPCDPNADCANTVGSYSCTCRHGYEGDGFDNCTGAQIESMLGYANQRCLSTQLEMNVYSICNVELLIYSVLSYKL